MSQIHVSKEGNCIYCGAKQKKCDECGRMFHSMRINHDICTTRCRKRKERRIREEALKRAAIKRLIEVIKLVKLKP